MPLRGEEDLWSRNRTTESPAGHHEAEQEALLNISGRLDFLKFTVLTILLLYSLATRTMSAAKTQSCTVVCP
jgi:hypothetical protein